MKALPGDRCLFCGLSNFQHTEICAARWDSMERIKAKFDAVVVDLKSGLYHAGFGKTNVPDWTDDINRAHSFGTAGKAHRRLSTSFNNNPEMLGYRGRTLSVIEVYRIPAPTSVRPLQLCSDSLEN